MPTTKEILGVVLGGGRGTRLYPLTKLRAKPAVPIGGKYRLIDIPISNCINAGIHQIAVLTQFKSVSLHRHISGTYLFDAFSRGFVQIWAAEQREVEPDWYQGTADAVRKQLLEIKSAGLKYCMILAGDHLYRMDFDVLAEFHWENEADITLAMQPVRKEDAPRLGLLKTEKDGRIVNFAEKPKDKETLEAFVSNDDPERPYLGSMGIYMFNTDVLLEILNKYDDDDFGGEVIPRAIESHKVFGYYYDGYWEDIGTIRSFYDTNLQMAQADAPFNFTDPTDPIYSRPRFLPGSTILGGKIEKVMLADGCCIGEADIKNAVIGLRAQIGKGVVIKDTIVMGADYYDIERRTAANEGVPLGVGEGSYIEGAIIDKNVRIAPGVEIRPFPRGTEIDEEDWAVRDGIVVVPKSTILRAGTKIGPE